MDAETQICALAVRMIASVSVVVNSYVNPRQGKGTVR
jgi:hypothetical protein